MSFSKKICIAISAVCLVILGVIFLSWHNRSVKEAEMTASERQKSNAEISSIYKRKVEEARTATELPSSETAEVTEEGESQGDEEAGLASDASDATAEVEGTVSTVIEDGQVLDSSENSGQAEDTLTPATQTPDMEGISSQGAYQMLKNQQPLRLLVVGDSIAAGKGASQESDSWPQLLADGLDRRFGSQVTLTNLAMDRASAFGTYAQVMEAAGKAGQEDQTSYDLAIICCGKDDGETSFGPAYEAAIRAIHKKYPYCTILAVREHDMAVDSVKGSDQKKINKAYHVVTADMSKAFAGKADQFVDEAGYPNDAGHKAYAQSIFAAIYQQAEKAAYDPVPDRKPVTEDAAAYENYTYYGADQFKKISQVSYEMETGKLEGRLGIDYYAYKGDESVTLDLDDESFSLSALDLDGEGQQVVRLVRSNFTVNKKIAVTFKDKDQADKFGGIIVTGK